MKLKDQVVSLELAKKLKELGVKQESLFYWSFGDVYEEGKEEWCVNYRSKVTKRNGVDLEWYAAFTVAELGEMLPSDIKAEALDRRFPFVANREATHDSDDAMIEAEQQIMEDFKSVFSELYDPDVYEDGFNCNIRLYYAKGGKKVAYFFDDEEPECSYEVFETLGDTEADARAKMLIYLIENKLVTV